MRSQIYKRRPGEVLTAFLMFSAPQPLPFFSTGKFLRDCRLRRWPTVNPESLNRNVHHPPVTTDFNDLKHEQSCAFAHMFMAHQIRLSRP